MSDLRLYTYLVNRANALNKMPDTNPMAKKMRLFVNISSMSVENIIMKILSQRNKIYLQPQTAHYFDAPRHIPTILSSRASPIWDPINPKKTGIIACVMISSIVISLFFSYYPYCKYNTKNTYLQIQRPVMCRKLALKKRGATSQCTATPHRSYTYFIRLFTGLGRIEDVHGAAPNFRG